MAGEIACADLNIQEMPSSSRIPMPRPGRNCSNDHRYTQGLRVALGTACAVIFLLTLAVVRLKVLVLQPKQTPEDTSSSSSTDSEFKLQLKHYMCSSPSHSGREDAPNCKICPNDWELHRDICYWISQGQKTWTESQDDCKGKNSTLLVIRDQQEMVNMQLMRKVLPTGIQLKQSPQESETSGQGCGTIIMQLSEESVAKGKGEFTRY
ncbi:killer cell lectin-like receptor subfamily B member 1B allele A [Podarcis raffonei]|uniref:killer cell lectin-like receptor subfamily B member 1B allele A n=1 Tax=Podarcis raffonei TaxID=65483 RepID=UPI00232923A7|nr:killer cell lectin-like receptor subfamily B member 1B allele A [Podarcis raffonei]